MNAVGERSRPWWSCCFSAARLPGSSRCGETARRLASLLPYASLLAVVFLAGCSNERVDALEAEAQRQAQRNVELARIVRQTFAEVEEKLQQQQRELTRLRQAVDALREGR